MLLEILLIGSIGINITILVILYFRERPCLHRKPVKLHHSIFIRLIQFLLKCTSKKYKQFDRILKEFEYEVARGTKAR